MPTSVALSSHFETFVRNQVESGRYNNASEVVRAGLRLLEDQQKQSELQLEAMKAAIAAGLASGRSIPGDQVFDRLEAKYTLYLQVVDANDFRHFDLIALYLQYSKANWFNLHFYATSRLSLG